MAVQAQFDRLLLPTPYAAAATPVADDAYAWQQHHYDYCAAQSDLTCNNGGGGGAVLPTPSRKRGRADDDDELLHYASFLPFQAMRPHSISSATAMASTSGQRAEAPATAAEHDALASELWRLHAEVDALVRAECDRLRAGLLEAARKRQRHVLVRAAVCGFQRRARDAEAQLEAARRRAAELEERVRLAAAEAQAWCGVARGNEAVAAGLRATLDALLLRSVSAVGEAFGESEEPEDAQSCCCYDVDARDTAAATASSPAAKWTCRSCGEGEASVLVLPCRHLCLCRACEPRADACPVCAGAKNAAIHIAPTDG